MIEIDENSFQKEVIESKGIYVVVFVKPGFEPSDHTALIIRGLDREYKKFIKTAFYDIKAGGNSVPRHLKIRWIPYVVFFLDGCVEYHVTGKKSLGYYEERIRKLMNRSGITGS